MENQDTVQLLIHFITSFFNKTNHKAYHIKGIHLHCRYDKGQEP